jgi:hypothetical protein
MQCDDEAASVASTLTDNISTFLQLLAGVVAGWVSVFSA